VISRQFRLLFAGQAVSVVGDALFPVALAFAVLDELDGTPVQLGIVLAAQTVPLAVLILASGVWADRLNRRNVMIVSDLGRAAAQAVLAGLAVAYGLTLWETTLGREIPPAALSRVTSLDWFTTTGAMPLGFALVAPAAQLFGTRPTMLACGLIVIGLCALALAAGDVRRLTAP
jgi:MFS family permease